VAILARGFGCLAVETVSSISFLPIQRLDDLFRRFEGIHGRPVVIFRKLNYERCGWAGKAECKRVPDEGRIFSARTPAPVNRSITFALDPPRHRA